VSEFALLRVEDDWLGFRDVYEVDGKPVRDRQDRLLRLFTDDPQTAISLARRINDEGARLNLGVMQRNFDVPTMALFFLQPSYSSRFRFRKDGEEKLGGTLVWKVGYEETVKPTIIRTSSGKDMPVRGTFWIDPVSGQVLKTHMGFSTETTMGPDNWTDRRLDHDADRLVRRLQSTASVTVTYTHNEALGILVPDVMLESYEGPSVNQFTGREEISR
jgi:hypothetical protein